MLSKNLLRRKLPMKERNEQNGYLPKNTSYLLNDEIVFYNSLLAVFSEPPMSKISKERAWV